MAEFDQKNSDSLGYPSTSPVKEKSKPKLIFSFVGVIGVAALFLGFLRLSQNIKGPFQPIISFTNSSFLSEKQLNDINLLKSKDTDGDGLSDYDELYYHNTSPYLKDSDSDGTNDKEEIENKTDPNCPAGQDCLGLSTNSNVNGATNTNASNSNSSLVTGGATAATLRETLKNAGVPQYILDSTDDAALLDIYNQTVTEGQNTNTNTNVNLNSNTNASVNYNSNTNTAVTSETPPQEFYDALKDLTPDEIRLLLVEAGLNEAQLNSMDNETLQAIFLKALEEQKST